MKIGRIGDNKKKTSTNNSFGLYGFGFLAVPAEYPNDQSETGRQLEANARAPTAYSESQELMAVFCTSLMFELLDIRLGQFRVACRLQHRLG